MKHLTQKTLTLTTLLLAGLVSLGCGPKQKQTVSTEQVRKQQGYPVKLVTARVKSLSQEVHFTGTVELPDTLNVTPEVGGTVLEVYVDKGDKVAPGDPLIKIDPTDYQNGVRQAEAVVASARVGYAIATRRQNLNEDELAANMRDTAKAAYEYDKWNLERMEKLYEAGVVSEQDLVGMRTKAETSKKQLESAQIQSRIGDAGMQKLQTEAALAQLRQAEAGLAFARTSLERTVMRSQVSGTVSLRMAIRGQGIGTSNPAFQILRDGPKKITMMLNEDDLHKIKLGQSILLTSTAQPGRSFQAKISYVPTFVFAMNRQAPAEAVITGGAEGLEHGMFVEGDIILSPEDHLVIPYKAVLENEIVWVAGKGDKAARRTCKEHTRIQHYISIEDACLKPGDRVVYQGQNLLSEGAKLKVLEVTQDY